MAMEPSTRRSLVIVLVLLSVAMVIWYFARQRSTKYDWTFSLDEQSQEPYGTIYFKKWLEKNKGPLTTIEQSFTVLEGEKSTPASFVLVGQACLFNQEEITALMEFAYRGNHVFISTRSIPFDFLEALLQEPCSAYSLMDYESTFYPDTAVWLNLNHQFLRDTSQDYQFVYYHLGLPQEFHYWSFWDPGAFCDSLDFPAPLGTLNDMVNFAGFKFGEGAVYLHTTPFVFTNFSLVDKRHQEYVEKVMSYLPEGPVYWDKKHLISEAVSRKRNGEMGFADSTQFEPSPLNYILSQPALAWAWYLLLAMGVLYLIFRAKRRQRIIPVLEPNVNTSLEFITTIGKLYFQRGNPRQLALQKMKFLQVHIRERYHMPHTEWNADFMDQLHLKSEVPRTILEKIAVMHQNISTSRMTTDNTLMEFHQLLSEFYKIRK